LANAAYSFDELKEKDQYSIVSSNSDAKIEYWSFSFNSSNEYAAFANDLGNLISTISTCCDFGQYCFNITQDYFPTEFSIYAMMTQSEYVTAVMPDFQFFQAHYQISATYNMYNNKYNCFSPSSVNCQYNTWCTFPCSSGFNVSAYVANATSVDHTVHTVEELSIPSKSLVPSPSRSKEVQRVGGGIAYWGMWIDAGLFYAAFTNSLADSFECSVPACDLGDYCFNVTDGESVPTEFQVFAVFENSTVIFYDVYDFSVRLSSNKYKLSIQLTSNYTTTDCPLTASDGNTISTCNYGDTCTATCPYNDVNIGFTLAQPSDIDAIDVGTPHKPHHRPHHPRPRRHH